MPTSGTSEWVVTAGDLIHSAAREIGAIAMGDELEDSEMDEAQVRLNNMLKSWSVEGNLFRETTGTLTITGGTGAATLPDDIRDVMTARHVLSTTNRRALARWNRDQYYAIPNRSAVGNPVAFYLSNQLGGQSLYVWPVPVANITLELDYGRRVETVTAPEEDLDIPQEWNEAVMYGLAARMSSMFGATKLDPATVQRVDVVARDLYQRLLDADRPDSYYFEPWQGCYG
jgi:hypothetical protein